MIKNSIKIKNLKLKIGLLIGLFAYLFISSITVKANGLSLSIDPPIIEIQVIPPTAVTAPLNIQNKSDTQVTLQIQLKAFNAKGENGELEYSGKEPEIFNNIQILDQDLQVEKITVGPKQQKKLKLNITIPKDTNISARPPAASSNQSQINQTSVAGEVGRDYYFSVLFISKNTTIPSANASLNQLGIATNVLLSIGTKETPNVSLEEFSSKILFDKGPVPFTIRVKNSGAHFIKPRGEIIIKNMFGQAIGRLDLASTNVLSDSIRAISDPKQPTILWKENFLLGLYTATLSISMSDEGPVFIKTAHFFAFPFKALIIIMIIIIMAVAIRNRLKLYK